MNTRTGTLQRLAVIMMLIIALGLVAHAQQKVSIILDPDKASSIINKNIYGQFSEHLGSCIYGGIWVGENSPIPNTRGIRNDVIDALKKLGVPVLRWPGGCFADEYHWKDGIGPRDQRPSMVNTNWGGVTEDNSFGTHEFLDLCELIGAEPYICGNLGSGTVQEMSEWVQYVTSDGKNPMADLRRKNGRNEPWKVKYWGIGNESWGCGGRMLPEYYADLARRYSTFTRNYAGNVVYKIGTGPNVDDSVWTDVVMKNAGNVINGLSLHYYTSAGGKPAAIFNEAGWFDVVKKALWTDDLVRLHSSIMDKYDPTKKVGLMVDEWGTWFAVEPGTNPGFLYQQNTLRDAMVAATSLNIFNNHSDRVRMTNIAQMVNVLQAMILTDKEKMLLTPTYHVFEMYKVHQNAILIPLELSSPNYTFNGSSIPAVNGSASITSTGAINLSLCNVDPNNAQQVTVELRQVKDAKVTGRVLTSSAMNALNSFDAPNTVKPAAFTDFKLSGTTLTVKMPAKSVVVLAVNGKVESKVGAPVNLKNPVHGLNYSYYEGPFLQLPDFDTLKLVSKGTIPQFTLPDVNTGSDFAVKYTGYIKIPKDGFYTFYTNSDDGTKLFIDGKIIVNNEGRHAPLEVGGFTSLNAGFHKIEMVFFQGGGGQWLDASIESQGMKKQIIPAEMLFHEK